MPTYCSLSGARRSLTEKSKKVLIVCVELEKAYDRVAREVLYVMWGVLDTCRVKGELTRAERSHGRHVSVVKGRTT